MVLEVALRSGHTEEELVILLKDKARFVTNGHAVVDYDESPGRGFELPDDVPIYTELPKGLITVPDAGRKYGISRRTIQTWLRKGRLGLRGRLRGPARSGGYMVVDEAELVVYMNAPRDKGGRPRKT